MNIITKFFRAINRPTHPQVEQASQDWKELFKIIEISRESLEKFGISIFNEQKEKLVINFYESDIKLLMFAVFLDWWADVTCHDGRAVYIGALAYTQGNLDRNDKYKAVTAMVIDSKNASKDSSTCPITNGVLLHLIGENNEDLNESFKMASFNALQIITDGSQDLLNDQKEKIQGLYLHYLFKCKFHGTYFFDIGTEVAAA